MARRNPEHSVTREPHLQGDGAPRPDASEARAARVLRDEGPDEQQAAEQSVWEEPTLSPALARPPEGDVPRIQLLRRRRGQVSAARSWAVTLGLALAAAPFAITGLFLGGGGTIFSVMAIVVFGPVAEEMMKVALPLYVAERRPYLFRGRAQIAACGLASGLAFAAVENLLYLNVYIPEPSSLLVQWRWSVCVALHTGCTLVCSLGVMRVWQAAWTPGPASLGRAAERAYPYAVAAAVIHGAYNGLMVLLSMGQFRF